MATEKLIERSKQQANLLIAALEEAQLPIKRTKALEYIARHLYGYASWNVLTGNSKDHQIPTTYKDFMRQITYLVNTIPSLEPCIEHLQFDNGQPNIMNSNRFIAPASALATMFLQDNDMSVHYDYFNFYKLVVNRYIDDSVFNHFPDEMRPTSDYDKFRYYGLMLDCKLYEQGQWPWEIWYQKTKAKGQINNDLLSLARAAYRECVQHGWDENLKVFCGLYDDGVELEKMLLEWPHESHQALTHLMDTDAGSMH